MLGCRAFAWWAPPWCLAVPISGYMHQGRMPRRIGRLCRHYFFPEACLSCVLPVQRATQAVKTPATMEGPLDRDTLFRKLRSKAENKVWALLSALGASNGRGSCSSVLPALWSRWLPVSAPSCHTNLV